MNILPLIENLINNFNHFFTNTKTNCLNLEENIINIGNTFTTDLYVNFIESLDKDYRNSKQRKQKYRIKEYIHKSLITSIGEIRFKYTAYNDKLTGERYCYIRDVLSLKPHQKLSEHAEYVLIKFAGKENMAQAARHALRNYEVSRSLVSKRIKNLDGSIDEVIDKVITQPDILYIEMDEIHANLQNKHKIKGESSKNHICPCAIVHEGHKETFVKRKELKNVRNFASSEFSYKDLWNLIYDFVDKKYEIDKFKAIFVSGDGAAGIKAYDDAFPNAIFVLDKFHYRKALKYIFKKESYLINIADEYIRNNMINDFKTLVKIQIEKYPSQEKYLLEKQDNIINNIEGIINQKHLLYKCPCSMEGHVSNRYARYITSSPFAFSKQGLKNKLKLLVMNANKHNLTFDEFLQLKYGVNKDKKMLELFDSFTNIKFDKKILSKKNIPHTISTAFIPKFFATSTNEYINSLIALKNK